MKRPKTGGRLPGSPNKITQDFRQAINDFLSRNWEQVQQDYDQLEGKDRLLFLERLLKYSVPVLNGISYEKLSDADLEKLAILMLEKMD